MGHDRCLELDGWRHPDPSKIGSYASDPVKHDAGSIGIELGLRLPAETLIIKGGRARLPGIA